jgi:hypothetical protein
MNDFNKQLYALGLQGAMGDIYPFFMEICLFFDQGRETISGTSWKSSSSCKTLGLIAIL